MRRIELQSIDCAYALAPQSITIAINGGRYPMKILLIPATARPLQIISHGGKESLIFPLMNLPQAYIQEKTLPNIPICAAFRISSALSEGDAIEIFNLATYIEV